MKTKSRFHKLERAQVLPIVVLGLFALIGMSALILDGGALMLNRRAAQNAADAGALAGARVYCNQKTYNSTAIESAVKKYTLDENNATSYSWVQDTSNPDNIEGLRNGEIVVTVEVEHGSFFAKIFNQDTLLAQATAAAGCFSYGPQVVLPIIFPCHTSLPDSSSPDCDYKMLDLESVISKLSACGVPVPLPEGQILTEAQATCVSNAMASHPDFEELIFIVANSDKFCADNPHDLDPNNQIICQLTESGRYQLNSSAHGWLNLSGGSAGENRLADWINGTETVTTSIHTWHTIVGGKKQGNNIWSALENRRGHIVWVPVINNICPDDPTTKKGEICWNEAHATPFEIPEGDTCNVVYGNPAGDFGHVVAFAPFYVTCVRRNNSKDECPGWNFAISVYPSLEEKPTIASVEGYFLFPNFLEGDSASIGGADLKIYRALLTR